MITDVNSKPGPKYLTDSPAILRGDFSNAISVYVERRYEGKSFRPHADRTVAATVKGLVFDGYEIVVAPLSPNEIYVLTKGRQVVGVGNVAGPLCVWLH